MQSAATVGVQVRRPDHQQAQAVSGDLSVASPVVQRPLLASLHSTHRQAPWFVEERRGLVVLHLAVFHDEFVLRPAGVDRQPGLPPCGSGIAEQPLEPVLPKALLAEDLVTQIEDVRLVAVLSPTHAPGCCHRPLTEAAGRPTRPAARAIGRVPQTSDRRRCVGVGCVSP
ncbi:hypothetical protein [Streptomyces sp. NPDC001978]|uniref:hypothetical protein n=1 Tax=Streptomyces sp. NPDC001978 TaxID=3364627 RepID=UPI0036C571D2